MAIYGLIFVVNNKNNPTSVKTKENRRLSIQEVLTS